jgi:hypothetical protein
MRLTAKHFCSTSVSDIAFAKDGIDRLAKTTFERERNDSLANPTPLRRPLRGLQVELNAESSSSVLGVVLDQRFSFLSQEVCKYWHMSHDDL